MRSAVAFSAILIGTAAVAQEIPDSPNGIAFPQGYEDWRVIAVSERTDNETLRVITGNDRAIEAARAGETNPWPDGAILAKIVWEQGSHENWETALVPTQFRHAEFMVKDASKFAETGGWGFARWLGTEQRPYGEDAEFAQECFGCHMPVKANDYVFTRPAPMP